MIGPIILIVFSIGLILWRVSNKNRYGSSVSVPSPKVTPEDQDEKKEKAPPDSAGKSSLPAPEPTPQTSMVWICWIILGVVLCFVGMKIYTWVTYEKEGTRIATFRFNFDQAASPDRKFTFNLEKAGHYQLLPDYWGIQVSVSGGDFFRAAALPNKLLPEGATLTFRLDPERIHFDRFLYQKPFFEHYKRYGCSKEFGVYKMNN